MQNDRRVVDNWGGVFCDVTLLVCLYLLVYDRWMKGYSYRLESRSKLRSNHTTCDASKEIVNVLSQFYSVSTTKVVPTIFLCYLCDNCSVIVFQTQIMNCNISQVFLICKDDFCLFPSTSSSCHMVVPIETTINIHINFYNMAWGKKLEFVVKIWSKLYVCWYFNIETFC